MKKKTIEHIFTMLQMQNPEPKTELQYSSPFELLIAVILSAQATDVSVNKATTVLYQIASTPEMILAMGEEKLKAIIKTIGLYQAKTKNILATCQLLITEYNSIVPSTRDALERLPGVGRKTANVVLNTYFGVPTIAVDTHVARVATRLGLTHATTPIKIELDLIQTIPKAFLMNAHHWLILHGRYICIARNPRCQMCSIAKWCDYQLNIGSK